MPEVCPRVLLIDSNPTLLLALSDALADAGLSGPPFVARAAEEALALLKGEPTIGLVVLDLGLGGDDGAALAHTILADFPHLRVILTGAVLCAERRAAFEGQALGLLEKPFDLEEFLELSYKGLTAP